LLQAFSRSGKDMTTTSRHADLADVTVLPTRRDHHLAAAFCDLEDEILQIKQMAAMTFDAVFKITESLKYDGIDQDRDTALFAVGHLKEMIESFSDEYHRQYDAQRVSLKAVQ
jgi:hypothetical protein